MAYIKLNDGSIKSVDDDELESLLTTGTGAETNSSTNIQSLPTAVNENALTQGLVGGSINAGSQYMDEGKINPKEVAVNALTTGLFDKFNSQ